MGPQHIRDGEIVIARQKTGVPAMITIHPELQQILDATAVTGFATFLVTKTGRPFHPNDLSEQFRQWCNEASLPQHLSLHGLRHTMGDKLAETGSSYTLSTVPGLSCHWSVSACQLIRSPNPHRLPALLLGALGSCS
jgi:site-specific recombinase XerC